jgi:tetratricopeptide (TPR) repeat protein
VVRRPGRVAWAWVAAGGLAVVLGAAGFWVNGALGAGIGVAAGVVAPLLVESARRRAVAREAARWAEPARRRLGPASLLDPALGVVPFTGRNAELSTLRRWCEDDAVGPVRLVTGGGGAGKTRLALELRRLLEAQGWRCAEVDSGNEANALSAERGAAGRRRLLLVVDYADAREGLAGLLDSIARDPGRVRVLLLARQAGEWWQRLEGGRQAVRDLVADAGRAVMELADAVAPGIAAADVVRGALPCFAAELKVSAPDPDLVSVTSAEGARVLDLHAAALVAVLGARKLHAGTAVSVNVRMVLDVLLGHEKHYWLAGASSLGLLNITDGLSAGQLSQVVAAACLLGAASKDEAAALASRVPGATASGAVALWLQGLYPPDGAGRWIGSLRPDRLAELHATRELAASEDLARACLSGLDERQARQALVLLARASADHEAARPLLESALFRFPDVLAGIEAPRETMIAVANSIRYPSVTLAEADASITGRIVATYPAGTAERASWQGTYSTLLAALGRREEALAAIEEAVSIHRDLAAAHPDTFRPALASSLSNQSGRLAELGRREEALAAIEEAVSIRRNLAAARPGAFRPDLAASLNNLSSCLVGLGRYEEALAAVEEAAATYRDLAAARPDAFGPDLAASLNNQSVFLAELGRPVEALAAIEEAVSIRRNLAAARPGAFRADLAASLSNQSGRLGELGRYEEALAAVEEAAATYRDLAAARPGAFRADVAMSLSNQSVFLAELGRPVEALAAIEEAVSIRRNLAAANPAAFSQRLAISLNVLAAHLAALGCDAEANAASAEAERISSQLP